MTARFEWTVLSPFVLVAAVAMYLVAWQVRVNRSVFERFFGEAEPTVVMAVAIVVGFGAIASLQGFAGFAVNGPGSAREAVLVVVVGTLLFAVAAICADLALRYDEDTNIAMPDALRVYPVMAVLVEIALHVVPVAVLVAFLGVPNGLDATFWRIAIPVALIEAALQAAYASSPGMAAFNAVHLTMFGVTQIWVFWRFGFVWTLGFRLAYYSLWHVAWGAARLHLLF